MDTSNSNRSPSQAGSQLLSRFVDTDHLFLKPGQEQPIAPVSKGSSISLERFQTLEQEIRQTPANSVPYIELAQYYLQQERLADARRVLDSGVSNCPECEQLLLMREDLLVHQAVLMLEQSKSSHAQEPCEQSKYDIEQAEINLTHERIRVCRDRYARHPEQSEILVTWAVALRKLGQTDEAIGLLVKAMQEPSLRARAGLQLGMCYQSIERPLDALSAFRRAALYRSPAADPKIKERALELALNLAEELGLVDSARYYAQELVDCCDPTNRPSFESRLAKLRAMEL